MNPNQLLQLFEQVHEGELLPHNALKKIKDASYTDLGFVKIDHSRQKRLGFPEVVFAENKSVAQLEQICRVHLEIHERLLITRLSPEKYEQLERRGIRGGYNPVARTLSFAPEDLKLVGDLLIICAGTSDLNVAQEAKETAWIMGNQVELISDLGVAGLHRLLDQLDRLYRANVIIVIAGMEGALASVVGGLVQVPVIAVPTSVGYGASFQGVAALLSMLNSCSPGVTVVNIDNGFGAAFTASLINNPVIKKS